MNSNVQPQAIIVKFSRQQVLIELEGRGHTTVENSRALICEESAFITVVHGSRLRLPSTGQRQW